MLRTIHRHIATEKKSGLAQLP